LQELRDLLGEYLNVGNYWELL